MTGNPAVYDKQGFSILPDSVVFGIIAIEFNKE